MQTTNTNAFAHFRGKKLIAVQTPAITVEEDYDPRMEVTPLTANPDLGHIYCETVLKTGWYWQNKAHCTEVYRKAAGVIWWAKGFDHLLFFQI